MAASGNLEGHGRPNVFLAGQVGQKYKDLDSGLEWVCTGERGFIKVDGDDQSEMYNWELVESGGSTGGGVFTVNFTTDPSNKSIALPDKTLDELHNAVDRGDRVIGMLGSDVFFERIPNNNVFDACGITVNSSAVFAFSFTGYEDSSKEMGWACRAFTEVLETVVTSPQETP